MSTLFISDLHLSGERPAMLALFARFLHEQATQAEALYILGDLFEYWIGDDFVPPDLAPVLAGLKQLSAGGVPVFVMHGNRDFLLGEQFAQLTGCQLLPDPTVIDLYGTPTLLMHGDTLCTDDVEYQQFRRVVRNPKWQEQLLAKPAAERIAMARALREKSQEKTREKAEYIMDANAASVEKTLREQGVWRLIHGHTHRPAVHDFTLDGRAAQRIVLGDWYEQGSLLTCDAQACRLTTC